MLSLEERRRKTLMAAVLISAVVHSIVFGTLIYRRIVKPIGKRGLIDVQFIEPVQHLPPVESGKALRRDLPTDKPIPQAAGARVSVVDPAEVSRLTESYIQQILQLISRKKTYPKEALQREQEGKVMVAVTVEKDGQVIETVVEEAAPFEALNSAALETIRSVGKFPPLPEGIDAPLHLHIPLVFKLDTR